MARVLIAVGPADQEGRGALTVSVVKAMGAMPPKGGAASEAELKAAIDYRISQSK